MFIVIGVWGGPNRVYAALKFFLYTLMGSLLSLVALIYLWNAAGGSFSLLDFYELPLPLGAQIADLHRVFRGVRSQGADVAGAYVAAGCARRGADRRFRGACGDHAEARRLRFPATVPADRARREPRACRFRDRAVADRGGLHRARRAGAGRYEEADRLLVDFAHGFRHARHFHLQRAGHGGRDTADDFARVYCRARCSCASASCTTACIRARSPITAVWSTRCRCSRRCSCCSRWPTPACRAPAGSSANGW